MNRYQKKCMKLAKIDHELKVIYCKERIGSGRKNGKTLAYQVLMKELAYGYRHRYRLYKRLYRNKKLSDLDHAIQNSNLMLKNKIG